MSAAQGKLSNFPYDSKRPVAEPGLFGEGIISTHLYERGGTFTPDGKSFYFSKRSPEGYFLAICVSHFSGGRWSAPEIAPFSGQYLDYDPVISPDGSKLFFTSRRPIDGKPRDDTDIWVVERTPAGWGEPRNLGAPVNTEAYEGYATVTRNGTLYFHSARPGGRGESDIYRSRLVNGKYSEPEDLSDAVNTGHSEIFPFIAPDESFLIFVALERSDEIVGDGSRYTRGDLYISFNRDGVWTPASHLPPPINSPAAESCPFITPDGKYLFFTSERGFMSTLPKKRLNLKEVEQGLKSVMSGQGNIFQVDVALLNLKR